MQGPGQDNVGRGFVHSEFGPVATRELVGTLSGLLSDGFALFVRTKRLQWQMPGPDLCERRALLARQALSLLAMVDRLALRIRVLGGIAASPPNHLLIANEVGDDNLASQHLERLYRDNQQLLSGLRESHGLCEEYGDVATSRLLAEWIDEAESRVLVLFEVVRPDTATEATTAHS